MAGRNKKKRASAKKQCTRKNDKHSGGNRKRKSLPLEEVLSQAESAMEMSEVDTALELFCHAARVLRSRVHAPTGVDAEGNGNISVGAPDRDKNDQDTKTLSTVLGKMGELKASNGDAEGARADFLHAIELLDSVSTTVDTKLSAEERECDLGTAQNIESRAGLHLYLGQLSSGTEALSSFRVGVSELVRAIRVLERIMNVSEARGEGNGADSADSPQDFLVESRKKLCSAYCSIAELYLTDLCEEPEAESSCEAALSSAMALEDDERNNTGGVPIPDAWQTMANFRLSQSRITEASECILKAYDRMKVGCEAMSALVGLGKNGNGKGDVEDIESKELTEVEATSSLPEYNFRCQTAKIMLECASLLEKCAHGDTVNRCAESAIQVCGSLLAENDEMIEVWYFLGCAFMACLPPNPDAAHYYWENALRMLNEVKKGLEESDGDNENELEMVECQIIDIKKKLGKNDEEDEEMEDSN